MTTAHNRLDRGSLTPILIAGLAVLLAVSGRAQSAPDVAAVVAPLHAYLDIYEPLLSALVADEVFEQRMTYVTEYGIRHVSERRRLVSDIGVLRLPGGLAATTGSSRPPAAWCHRGGRRDACFARKAGTIDLHGRSRASASLHVPCRRYAR